MAALLLSGQAATGTYTVKWGDTLSGVAKRFGVSVPALAQANGIANSNRVKAGAKLVVPSAAASSSASAGDHKAPTMTNARGQTVKLDASKRALIPIFNRWAKAYGVPADLVKAVAWQESGWQNHVVSSANAKGIGQITPVTGRYIANELLRMPSLDERRPDDNIRMSARYLRYLLDRAGGSTTRALASYYQGPTSVARYGPGRDTLVYVANIQALRTRF